MTISVVMPVHNEAELLPYSLASLAGVPIDELVLLLDRCSDGSLAIVERFADLNHQFKVEIHVTKTSSWQHGIAEAFERVFSLATGDYLFTMAADMVTDPRIYSFNFERCDLASFYYRNCTFGKRLQLHEEYVNFVSRLPGIYTCGFGKWSGHFAMKREVWEKLHYRDVRSPDLEFFNRAFAEGFTHRYVSRVKNTHLRCGLQKERQILQGVSKAEAGVHPFKVIGHALVCLKPRVAASYLSNKVRN